MHPSTPKPVPVFKRVEEANKKHVNAIGHPPLTRTRTPKLHTARRCELRANREQIAARSITKDELAPCLKHREKLFSPPNMPKFQKNGGGKMKKQNPGEELLGVKTKNTDISQSPKRKPNSQFFESFIANQIFNTPERKTFKEPVRIDQPKIDAVKDTNGLGRSLWNKKDRLPHQENQRSQKPLRRSESNGGTRMAKSESRGLEEMKGKEESKTAFTTPQNKIMQENRNENCMSVGQESKVESILNLLLIDSKHTRELIQKAKEGAQETQLLVQLSLKENNLEDLRHILEERKPQPGKRKSMGGGSAKARSCKKK